VKLSPKGLHLSMKFLEMLVHLVNYVVEFFVMIIAMEVTFNFLCVFHHFFSKIFESSVLKVFGGLM
jgi:hypothetical protein